MNHTDALKMFAAEKYLLNELPAPVRDEFEEHFFECQQCAMDVRAGATFIDAARAELKSAPRSVPAKSRSFFSILALPLAGALISALAAVVIYQNTVTLPSLRSEVAAANAPAILPATSLIGSASRGSEMPSATAATGHPLFLNVDVPTDDRFTQYQLTFYDPAGSPAGTVQVSPDQAKNTLLIRLPAREIHAGVYTLAVEGQAGSGQPAVQLAQYRFRVLNEN